MTLTVHHKETRASRLRRIQGVCSERIPKGEVVVVDRPDQFLLQPTLWLTPAEALAITPILEAPTRRCERPYPQN
jgi:hypothetical protein